MEQRLPVETARSRRLRTSLTIFFAVVSAGAGLGFLVKLAEFLLSLDDPDILGFAVAPLANYFCVAGGFLALLIWAFLSGHFSNIEQPKHDLLRDQELLDEADPWVQRLEARRQALQDQGDPA